MEMEGTRRRHQVDTIVEGIGTCRLTGITRKMFENNLIDDAYKVTDDEAIEMSRNIINKEGLFIGSSSAVNLVACEKLANQLGPGHTIVTILW